MRDGVGVLREEGLVVALCIAVSKEPGYLLLQHGVHGVRQVLAFRHYRTKTHGEGFNHTHTHTQRVV